HATPRGLEVLPQAFEMGALVQQAAPRQIVKQVRHEARTIARRFRSIFGSQAEATPVNFWVLGSVLGAFSPCSAAQVAADAPFRCSGRRRRSVSVLAGALGRLGVPATPLRAGAWART